jgi:hypothetical protein
MMLLEVSEADIAINADAEMAGELITGGRLKSEREGFALFICHLFRQNNTHLQICKTRKR